MKPQTAHNSDSTERDTTSNITYPSTVTYSTYEHCQETWYFDAMDFACVQF